MISNQQRTPRTRLLRYPATWPQRKASAREQSVLSGHCCAQRVKSLGSVVHALGALSAIDNTAMLRATAVRHFGVPVLPIIGAFLAKKAVASYAIFNAVHSYGIPKLFRQVAHATRAWGVDAAARREFLYLVKGGGSADQRAGAPVRPAALGDARAAVRRRAVLSRTGPGPASAAAAERLLQVSHRRRHPRHAEQRPGDAERRHGQLINVYS